jgi:addiction module HigA family antidote
MRTFLLTVDTPFTFLLNKYCHYDTLQIILNLKGAAMPKASAQTPPAVLKSLMDEYQLNPIKLAGEIKLSNSSVRQILLGKSRVTASTALRLAKFFGNTPDFWLNLQNKSDLADAVNDKDTSAALKTIEKVKKPVPVKAAPKKAPAAKAKTAKAPKKTHAKTGVKK